jgi:hypothetical protein
MGAGGAFYVQVFQYIDPAIAFGSGQLGGGAAWRPSSAAWARCAARCSARPCCTLLAERHAQPVRPALA